MGFCLEANKYAKKMKSDRRFEWIKHGKQGEGLGKKEIEIS